MTNVCEWLLGTSGLRIKVLEMYMIDTTRCVDIGDVAVIHSQRLLASFSPTDVAL